MPTPSGKNLDKTLDQSFPASDPPSHSGVTGFGRPTKPSHDRGHDEKPTSTPTSDQHATETAHHWEDDAHPGKKPE